MSNLSEQNRLKNALARTWDVLLARFGRFTQIQLAAIDPLLNGKNCLLISPTSSGKTEAALAPLLERYLSTKKSLVKQKLSILYISPTRALVRDLDVRLQGAMKKLALKMQIKTGDEPSINLKNLPELLITTPESFDSLLVHKPRIAKDIEIVILDEIHLYDNTPRGDQLRILLNRLRKIKNFAKAQGDIISDKLQFCAMSATVSEPEKMAARYFENSTIINVLGKRQFSVDLLPLLGEETFIEILNKSKQKDCKKILCFCQKRLETEEWAQKIQNKTIFREYIFIHHSNLDRKARHKVEEAFAKAPVAICFTTSTLELGIDIGDLDLVILVGPPDSTASFLQRIGRANRRTSLIKTVCFYRNTTELALFKVFVQRARDGVNDEVDYFFRPSVIVQQLCSYIKQTHLGEINPEQAYSLFSSPTGKPLIDKLFYDEIIVYLVNKQIFNFSNNWILKPDKIWQKLYEEHKIYSNISYVKTFEIIDDQTGRKLGQTQRSGDEGDLILFAGKSRRIVKRVPGKIIVQIEETKGDFPNLVYGSSSKTFSRDIAKAVTKELNSIENNVENSLSIYPHPEIKNVYLILHSLGEARGFVLSELLETHYFLTVIECDWASLVVEGELPKKINFSLEQTVQVVSSNWRRLEPLFELGAYNQHLPLSVRQNTLIKAFDIDKALSDINKLFQD